MRELYRRLRFLLDRTANAADLKAEMDLHRDLRAAKLGGAEVADDHPRLAAERRFGNQTLLHEASMEAWGWPALEDFLKDIRYALRMFFANPLFYSVVVLTLSLGIGANTAIFSVTNAVLLRALPVHDPLQVFYLHVQPGQPDGASNTGNSDSSFSAPIFEQLRSLDDHRVEVAAYVPAGIGKVAVRAGVEPEEATVFLTSGDFFSKLGIAVVCGRPLTFEDERQHAAVAVISYAFWTRRFHGDCAAIGQTLYVKGVPMTVAGVAAKSFVGIEEKVVDVWLPLQRRPELNAWGTEGDSFYASPNWWCLKLLARLGPGITPAGANALLDPVFQTAAYASLGGKPQKGEIPRRLEFVGATGVGETGEPLRKPLYVLLTMVGVILVIACGNVAMLLVARNAGRQKEFSVRLAIGGSRARLFRQLLAESILLVMAGTAVGWTLATFAARALGLWVGLEVSADPDFRVLLGTVLMSALAALVFGLAPLGTAISTPILEALRSVTATAFPERSGSRVARATVAVQIALCLSLLVTATLLVGTLRNLRLQDLGLRTGGLIVFGLAPQAEGQSGDASVRFFDGLLTRLRALPGVENATLMGNRIGSGWSNNTTAVVDGLPGGDPRLSGPRNLRWNNVGPNYFTTLGIPIRLGRDFTENDGRSAPAVAIVNETIAKRFFEGREVLGHQVSFTRERAFTIVGVAANNKYTQVREPDTPMAWFPYAQVGGVGTMHVEVRVSGQAGEFLPTLRRTVTEYAPGLPLLKPMTQQAVFDDTIAQEQLLARLGICFGVLSVVLVATGLYGTLAYRVRRRTPELGVRMAMGARRVDILWMILRESLLTTCVGALVGLPLTFFSTRVLASLLYGMAPNDPLAVTVGLVGIALVSIAAGLIPAVRAASLHPVSALRYE